jgi:hypothetical protein
MGSRQPFLCWLSVLSTFELCRILYVDSKKNFKRLNQTFCPSCDLFSEISFYSVKRFVQALYTNYDKQYTFSQVFRLKTRCSSVYCAGFFLFLCVPHGTLLLGGGGGRVVGKVILGGLSVKFSWPEMISHTHRTLHSPRPWAVLATNL